MRHPKPSVYTSLGKKPTSRNILIPRNSSISEGKFKVTQGNTREEEERSYSRASEASFIIGKEAYSKAYKCSKGQK